MTHIYCSSIRTVPASSSAAIRTPGRNATLVLCSGGCPRTRRIQKVHWPVICG
ncbi:uncharacterized protein HMPREF1541_00453 [Cyphellophora europaea CBS 101466]|uniref:Uncharacterized protein n=1 Tax=Cyphellophora europaea (strain CBS 101466) TaxID=1220924 RepID=W2SEC8_CYPE1|nr:uncharacterized protein HMPREF1541_00453 [Cyphellophora europaea CBS 101466]ETN46269.1 hypothetical protein HMPREF1541_00453 [Cyphellophora europaea CBS 101466]